MNKVNQSFDTSVRDTLFDLFSRIVCASNYAHILHLNAKSGGQHLMLEKIYETLDDMIDEFGEVVFMSREIDIPNPLEKSSEYGSGDLGDLLNQMLDKINYLCTEDTVDESVKSAITGFGADIERCLGFWRQSEFDNNNGEHKEMKISKESILDLVKNAIQEAKMDDEEIEECGCAGCGATTTADLGPAVQYLGAKKKENESSEQLTEEENLEEMARWVLQPQEITKRRWNTFHSDAPFGTADSFIKKVLLNPEHPEHDKWLNEFINDYNTYENQKSLSDTAFIPDLTTKKNQLRKGKQAALTYLQNLMQHRKDYHTAYHATSGGMNNYGREVVHRNGTKNDDPFGPAKTTITNDQGGIPEVSAKNSVAPAKPAKKSPLATKIISDYDSTAESGDYKTASTNLKKALNSKEFKALSEYDQLLALNQITNDITGADLTQDDYEFVRTLRQQISWQDDDE